MSIPNRQFDESLVRIQAKRLQDARLALGLTIHDFIQPLSTSRAQLDAVERANLDAFYAPFYYERLFRRYAEALSFATETIDEMVESFSPSNVPIEDAEDPLSVATDPDAHEGIAPEAAAAETVQPLANPDEADTGLSGSIASNIASESAEPTKPSVAAPQEREPGRILASAPSSRLASEKRKSGFGSVSLVLVLSVALLAAWLFTHQGDDRKVLSAEPKPATATAGSEYSSPASAEAASESKPTAEAGARPASESSSSPASTTTPTTAAPALPPATPGPSSVAVAPAGTSPAGSASPAAATGTSGVPAMEIVPTGRSWIWVRQADESIREFAVPAGERVVFEEMPIYIVLARPEQAEVKISGRPVRLGRNDAERDLGRFGRSQLIEARSQGSTPSVPLAPRPAPTAAPASSSANSVSTPSTPSAPAPVPGAGATASGSTSASPAAAPPAATVPNP